MNDQQLQLMRFTAKDWYIRALYHRVPRAYFVMQCIVTGMIAAWRIPEREHARIDRIMEDIRKSVDRMTAREIEEYSATRESEWKYWRHD